MNLSTATAKFENRKLALQSFFLIAQSAALFLPIALSFQHLPYLRYDVQGLLANCLGLVFCGLVLLFAAPSKPRWASWLVIFAIYLCIAALISGARFPQLESLSIWIYLLLLLLCGQAGGLKAYAIFGSICALIAIFQVNFPSMLASWAFVPGDMSANYLAFFLILPLAATFSLAADSARNFGKILWLLLAGLVIAAIVSTDSRAVILGLLIAIPCWALTKARVSRPLLWSGILVLVLGMGLSILLIETSPEQLLTIFGDSAGGRLRRWINAWPMIRDHFWFGVGPGNWLPGYLPYQHSVVADARGYPAAFNSYLEIWGELGFVGLGLFAALILAILATWLNGDRKNKIIFGAVVAQLTAAAFHPVFSSELLAPSVMVALGLLSREELSPPQPSPSGWRLALGGMVLFLAAALPFRWTSLSAKLATYETEMGALPFFAQDPKEINWLRRALATWSLVSANSPQELGQFSSGRFRNFYGNFARREEESRGPAAAIPAWQRAVADFGNHPGNNEHLIHALRVSGDVKQARAIGDLSASRFQFQPALIAEYARALEQDFEYQAARLFYSKAQAAYQQLLGGDYFGKSGQAEKYFIEQGKKQVEERINYLERLQKLPELDPALKAVIDTPVINGIGILRRLR